MLSNTGIFGESVLNRAFWTGTRGNTRGMGKGRARKDRNNPRAVGMTPIGETGAPGTRETVSRMDYGDISVIDNTHRDKEGDSIG